jgi:hypothetical protein
MKYNSLNTKTLAVALSHGTFGADSFNPANRLAFRTARCGKRIIRDEILPLSGEPWQGVKRRDEIAENDIEISHGAGVTCGMRKRWRS